MRERSSSILIGVIFIILGIGFFINQLGINIGFNIFDFWPVFIILVGLYTLLKSNIFWGFIITGFGVAFLVDQFTNINAIGVFWPLIIVAVGVSILIKPRNNNKHWSRGNGVEVNQEKITESIAFTAAEWRITSRNFKGGKVDALFAGFELDLRDAVIAPEGAELTIGAVFGGGEVFIPEDMRVEVKGEGIMGGWSNKFRSSTDSSKPLLKIKGSAIFGGVDVKN